MNSTTDNQTGAIDAVQQAKTVICVRDLQKRVFSFKTVSPATLRRFERKAAAQIRKLEGKL